MGAQNCCQKREDDIGGIPPIGSIMRRRTGDEEDLGDQTNMDVAALIRLEHEKQRLNQSHINLLDESILSNFLNQSGEERAFGEMRSSAKQNRRFTTNAALQSERNRSFQNGSKLPSDVQIRLNNSDMRTGLQQSQDRTGRYDAANRSQDQMLSMMMAQDERGLFNSSGNRDLNDPNIDSLFSGQYKNFYNPNSDSMEYYGSRNMQKAAAQSRAQKAPHKAQGRDRENAKQDDSGYRDRDGDYVDAKGRYQRATPKEKEQLKASYRGSDLLNGSGSQQQKDREDIHKVVVPFNVAAHAGGQSTDDSSYPRNASKSISKTASDIDSAAETTYIKVRLTKDVLHAFEEQTRTSPIQLIQLYLERCQEEVGDVEGLLTTGSDSRTSSSDEEDSESEEDEEDSGEEGSPNQQRNQQKFEDNNPFPKASKSKSRSPKKNNKQGSPKKQHQSQLLL